MRTLDMHPVESSQIAEIGHDADTLTLAIRFKNWKGEATSLYHYQNVSAAEFEALRDAESIGRHFGQHIKPHADRYPYTKIESAPPSLPAAA